PKWAIKERMGNKAMIASRYSIVRHWKKVLAPSWKYFIQELQSDAYKSFWREMLGLSPRTPVILTMHWHYA
ncbi:hypothetical protein GGI1_16384, partial [Acidithiobacillus sp. GGI-221]